MESKEWIRDKVPGWESEEPDWKVASFAAILAGVVTRKLVTKTWKKWQGEAPPTNPASSSTGWGEALAWTAAVSVAVGTARLLARRGATAARARLES